MKGVHVFIATGFLVACLVYSTNADANSKDNSLSKRWNDMFKKLTSECQASALAILKLEDGLQELQEYKCRLFDKNSNTKQYFVRSKCTAKESGMVKDVFCSVDTNEVDTNIVDTNDVDTNDNANLKDNSVSKRWDAMFKKLTSECKASTLNILKLKDGTQALQEYQCRVFKNQTTKKLFDKTQCTAKEVGMIKDVFCSGVTSWISFHLLIFCLLIHAFRS